MHSVYELQQELLGDYFADNQVSHKLAAMMMASALGRLIADKGRIGGDWRDNVTAVVAVIESFAQPDETTH